MASRNYSVDLIKEAADELGVELDFRPGKRHWKVFLGPKMIMILPHGNPKNQGRALLNNIAQLRRAVEGRAADTSLSGRHSK